ncbi:MAG TPA: hypothetical protein VGE72_25030 [Azospirillum sp.]
MHGDRQQGCWVRAYEQRAAPRTQKRLQTGLASRTGMAASASVAPS